MKQIGMWIFLAVLLVVGVPAAIWSLGFLKDITYTKPRQEFAENAHIREHYRFVRDALSNDDVKLVDELHKATPLDIFSPANLNKYWAGQGYEVEWVILHDPRTKYGTNSYKCEPGNLRAFEEFGRDMGNERRREVAETQGKFERCVEEFKTALSIARSVKIGIDDTNGVDEKLREFVTRKLQGVEDTLVSPKDSTRLTVFRITGTTFLDMDDAKIAPGMKPFGVHQVWTEKLEWLTQQRESAKRSSIAIGLFNVLAQKQDTVVNKVYLFSDGIENSPLTIDMYPLLKSPHGWDPSTIDEAIRKALPDEKWPDLSNTTVTWYFPPVTWLNPPVSEASYKTAQKYWRHVLVDLCHSKNVEMIY